MKYFFAWIAFFVFAIILVPLILNMSFSKTKNQKPSYNDSDILVYFPSEDKVKTMKTEEYIRGVLMAEMPAEFELEALKAQAVAARSYMAQKRKDKTKDDVHPDADVCTDNSHCQAYIDDKAAKDKWDKKRADEYFDKCTKAVQSTAGEIVLFDNEPIKAVFHSVSGGRTENAADVWNGSVSYLKSVDSPGEEVAPKYESTAEFSVDEFKRKLKDELGIEYSGNIGSVSRSEGGAVKSVEISGTDVKGTDIRRVFELNSANFEIKAANSSIVFHVIGYGHGVGMSQYGANYCAKQGMNYKEILRKYYSGISFGRLDA